LMIIIVYVTFESRDEIKQKKSFTYAFFSFEEKKKEKKSATWWCTATVSTGSSWSEREKRENIFPKNFLFLFVFNFKTLSWTL
jgi:hypothetical protein